MKKKFQYSLLISLVQVISMFDTMQPIKAVWVFLIKGNKNCILLDPEGYRMHFKKRITNTWRYHCSVATKVMSRWNRVGVGYCRGGVLLGLGYCRGGVLGQGGVL